MHRGADGGANLERFPPRRFASARMEDMVLNFDAWFNGLRRPFQRPADDVLVAGFNLSLRDAAGNGIPTGINLRSCSSFRYQGIWATVSIE